MKGKNKKMEKENIYFEKIQIFKTAMKNLLEAALEFTKGRENEESNINQAKREIKKNIQRFWGKKDEIFISELINENFQKIINEWHEDIIKRNEEGNINDRNYEEKYKIVSNSAHELWSNTLIDGYYLNSEFFNSFHYTFESLIELFNLNKTIQVFLTNTELIEFAFVNSTEKNDILANFYCRKFNIIEKMLIEASAELFSKNLADQNARDKFDESNVYDLLFNELLKPRLIKGNKFVHYSFLVSEEKLIKNEFEYIEKKYYDSGLFYLLRDYRNNITHSFGAAAIFYKKEAYISQSRTIAWMELLNWLIIYIAINIEENIKIMKI